MRPSQSLDNELGMMARDAIFLRKPHVSEDVWHVIATDRHHDLGRQAGTSHALAMRVSTLLLHVPAVLLRCPEKQVSGIDTRRVIAAGAVMQDMKPIWNWAVSQFPRETMGANLTPIVSELSVALPIPRRRPQPAIAGSVDLGPEAFLGRHGQSPKSCSVPVLPSPAALSNATRTVPMHAPATSPMKRPTQNIGISPFALAAKRPGRSLRCRTGRRQSRR